MMNRHLNRIQNEEDLTKPFNPISMETFVLNITINKKNRALTAAIEANDLRQIMLLRSEIDALKKRLKEINPQ